MQTAACRTVRFFYAVFPVAFFYCKLSFDSEGVSVSDWDPGEICADTQTGDVAAGQRDVQGERNDNAVSNRGSLCGTITQFRTVAFHKEERCSCAPYLLSGECLKVPHSLKSNTVRGVNSPH